MAKRNYMASCDTHTNTKQLHALVILCELFNANCIMNIYMLSVSAVQTFRTHQHNIARTERIQIARINEFLCLSLSISRMESFISMCLFTRNIRYLNHLIGNFFSRKRFYIIWPKNLSRNRSNSIFNMSTIYPTQYWCQSINLYSFSR